MGAFIPGIVIGIFPPKPDDLAEVVVVNDYGSKRVVSPDEVSDFPPETPQKRIVSDS